MKKLRELMAEWASLSVDTAHPRIIGSLLHDFYTGIERIFQKIAAELEGGIPEGSAWHKALLDDMALKIQEVRPAVITILYARNFDDYLPFRPLFRGSYGFELESE